MKNIIIDADPGHDDIIAFLVALANDEKLNILGYTTVCGNSNVEKCARNILKIQDYLGVKIPVAVGYPEPLCRPLDNAAKYHGETGLDGCLNYPEATSKPVQMHALDFLKEMILGSKEKVTLVTMGPLTNVAMLLKTYPEVINNIDEIVAMGGSYNSGNQLAKAEFNIFADPEAAKIVCDSEVRIVLATIEACYSGGVLLTEQERFADGGKVSRLVYDILKFYSRYAIRNGWDRTAIFDMTTVVYLLAPEIFEYEDMKVDIELNGKYTRGMTVCDNRGPEYNKGTNNLKRVLLGCDREKLVDILFASIGKLDERFGD